MYFRRLLQSLYQWMVWFMPSLLILFAILIATTPPASARTVMDQKKVRIGILANRGMDQTYHDWSPTAEYLSKQLAPYTFVIIPLNPHEIGPSVEKGAIDFLLTNSSSYVEMEALYGASRILTMVKTTSGYKYTVFGSVIFTRSDRKDIRKLTDLLGKTVMASDRSSFGGFQVAWHELLSHGMDPFTDFKEIQFSGFPQDNVVYAVRGGQIDAGIVRTDILESMTQEGKIKMSEFFILNQQKTAGFPLIHSTRLFPEWPLAKLKHTPEELARIVTIAFLNITPDNPAAQSANIAGWTIPLDYQPVHECMKTLRIGPYKNYGKITFAQAIQQYWPFFVSAVVALCIMAGAIAYVQKINRNLRQARLDAEYLASTDYLTGLLNRRAFMERLEAEVRRSMREGTPLSIILADIDDFKEINDRYGHQAGDVVLQVFAASISQLCRLYDFIGRYGGEEFIICLPGATSQQAARIAERMRLTVEEKQILLPEKNCKTRYLKITSSFGVASLDGETIGNIDSLIHQADQALYQAKAHGKNQTCRTDRFDLPSN